MIGKIAKNRNTNEVLGIVIKDLNESWLIRGGNENEFDLPKNLVVLEESSSDNSAPDENTVTQTAIGTAPNENITLITFNQFAGVLSIIGAVGCVYMFWPDKSLLSAGYEFKSAAYLPAIATGVSGLISALIFFNFAALLSKK
jgi:hypothetical protein